MWGTAVASPVLGVWKVLSSYLDSMIIGEEEILSWFPRMEKSPYLSCPPSSIYFFAFS